MSASLDFDRAAVQKRISLREAIACVHLEFGKMKALASKFVSWQERNVMAGRDPNVGACITVSRLPNGTVYYRRDQPPRFKHQQLHQQLILIYKLGFPHGWSVGSIINSPDEFMEAAFGLRPFEVAGEDPRSSAQLAQLEEMAGVGLHRPTSPKRVPSRRRHSPIARRPSLKIQLSESSVKPDDQGGAYDYGPVDTPPGLAAMREEEVWDHTPTAEPAAKGNEKKAAEVRARSPSPAPTPSPPPKAVKKARGAPKEVLSVSAAKKMRRKPRKDLALEDVVG